MSKNVINFVLGIIIEIIDLYLNYNGKDFPEFHEARVKFNEYALLSPLLFLLLLISVSCGPCCTSICIICYLFILLSGFYYLFFSFYLYFFYDGMNKINNILIHFFLWLNFIPYMISIITIIFTLWAAKTRNTDSTNNDLYQQNNYQLV